MASITNIYIAQYDPFLPLLMFLDAYEEQRYCSFEFWLRSDVLRSEVTWWESETPPNLGAVTVLGINIPVSEVKVNEVAQPFKYDTVNKVCGSFI